MVQADVSRLLPSENQLDISGKEEQSPGTSSELSEEEEWEDPITNEGSASEREKTELQLGEEPDHQTEGSAFEEEEREMEEGPARFNDCILY